VDENINPGMYGIFLILALYLMCVAMLFGPAHSLVFQPTGILLVFPVPDPKTRSWTHPVPGYPDTRRIPCAKNTPDGTPLKRTSPVLYLVGFFRFLAHIEGIFLAVDKLTG
jgi:hypothetical protein